MVKIGIRKPSWKISIAARTKGQLNRKIKRAIIPGYGQRGVGWAHPKRKLYNKAYSRTTFSFNDLLKQNHRSNTSTRRKASIVKSNGINLGCGGLIVLAVIVAFAIQIWPIVLFAAAVTGLIYYLNLRKKRAQAAKKEKDISENEAITKLHQYKSLLDQGAITRAEYDVKKGELLHIPTDSTNNDKSTDDNWNDF